MKHTKCCSITHRGKIKQFTLHNFFWFILPHFSYARCLWLFVINENFRWIGSDKHLSMNNVQSLKCVETICACYFISHFPILFVLSFGNIKRLLYKHFLIAQPWYAMTTRCILQGLTSNSVTMLVKQFF